MMANVVENLKYTKDHEWVKIEGGIATEGITDYAQSELSDIVMVEPPKIGRKVKSGDAVGTIEAVKAVSDLYAALSGEVVAVNEAVVKDPSLINKDPYNQGWLYKVKVENAKEADNLLTSDQYKELVASH
jgi:glycine cleavage system H protein